MNQEFGFDVFDVDDPTRATKRNEFSFPARYGCLSGHCRLIVGRDRSVRAVEAAIEGDNLIVVATQRVAEVQDPGLDDVYTIGVEMVAGRVLRMPDGTTSILGQGRRRVRLLSLTQNRPYLRVQVQPLAEPEQVTLGTEALMRAVLSLFEKAVQLSRTLPEDAYVAAMNLREPGPLADLIASLLDLERASARSA